MSSVRGHSPDTLKFESNPARQTALAWACIAIGAILAIAFRHFSGPGMSNNLAGFLLGLLLLLIGISGFIVRGRQVIVIDPRARSILVEDTNLFRTNKRLIRFSEIVDTGIGYVGKKSNYVTFYYILLKLSSGEEYPLFSPGRFFDGGSDREIMEARRQDLEGYLRQPYQ